MNFRPLFFASVFFLLAGANSLYIGAEDRSPQRAREVAPKPQPCDQSVAKPGIVIQIQDAGIQNASPRH